MAKRTVDQVKVDLADMLASNDITADDIKAKAAMVNLSLTNEQVGFVIAATEDDTSDANWRELLTEMYTGTEQSVVDRAWDMTGFDGTDEERMSMLPYIEAFKAEHGRVPNLSPNALWAVLTDTDNQSENNTPAQWNETIAEAEPDDEEEEIPEEEASSRVSDATANITAANRIAELLASNADLMADLTKVEEYNTFIKIAPLLMMAKVEKAIGGDTMLAAPEPGSISRGADGKETFHAMVGNTLFDIYKVPKGKKMERRSYYGNVYAKLPQGIYTHAEIEKLDAGDDKRGEYTQANGWGEKRRKAWRGTINQRINNGTKAIRKVFELYRQFDWLKSFKDIHVEIITDQTGGPAQVASPFWVCPMKADGTPNQGDGESYSIGELLAFDRVKTEANGNNYDALMKSRQRKSPAPVTAEAKAGEQPKAEALQVGLITDMRQFDSYSAMLAHFAETSFTEDYQGSDVEKNFNKELATNDALVLSWVAIGKFVRAIEGRLAVRARAIEAKEIQAKGNVPAKTGTQG